MIWTGFVLAVLVLMILSRRDLALALFAAALLLGIFTFDPDQVWNAAIRTFADPSIILLALVVGIIPIIGGVLEESGQMDALVDHLHIGERAFFILSPALLGLLPMPGGALLSAPLLARGSKTSISGSVKVAVNVWFRHILLLVYPLAPALIASAKIAGLDVYRIIPYLLPGFVLAVIIGYHFWIQHLSGAEGWQKPVTRESMVPIAIILLAPAADLFVHVLGIFAVRETATLIGVSLSLAVAFFLSSFRLRDLYSIGKEMHALRFAGIIFGMFLFLHVFQETSIPSQLEHFPLSPIILCVLIGFLLGFITGRIQVPVSIIVPIFLVKFGVLSLLTFAIMYFSIFLGYVISPIHPCVAVSIEYFQISFRRYFLTMALPTVLALLPVVVVAFFIF